MNKMLESFRIALVAALVLLPIMVAPTVWNYTPDSGYYIGTAVSLFEEQRYWFNGYPNLQYYPGLVLPLAGVISLAGVNFAALHLMAAVFASLALVAVAVHFSPKTHGLLGTLTFFFVALSSLVVVHYFRILSDLPFLAVTVASLITWKRWQLYQHKYTFAAFLFFTLYAPLLRFQGLFLIVAFAIAYPIHLHLNSRTTMLRKVLMTVGWVAFLISPFAVWTLRNYLVYSPDTFNMANAFFFGQDGLRLYAPGGHALSWIDAQWKYPAYRIYLMVQGLADGVLGNTLIDTSNTLVLFGLGLVTALGIPSWWKRGSVLEGSYVTISVLFIIYRLLQGGVSAHVVPRYWIPLLPFIFFAFLSGIEVFCREISRRLGINPMPVVLCLTTVLVFWNGFVSLQRNLNSQSSWQTTKQALAELAAFGKNDLGDEVVVATTEWGVVPFTLHRQTINLLNDPEHDHSIARMEKYRATHLVAFHLGAASRPARSMIGEYPEAFTLLFSTPYEQPYSGRRQSIDLYEVDMRILKSLHEADRRTPL